MSFGIVNLRLNILMQEDIRMFQRYVEVMTVEGSVTRREVGGGGMRRGVKRSEAAVGVGEMAATACKERSVWKWRRQPTRACRRQQSFLDTFAAAAVLAVIIGIDDALEEIMIVQLARAHQIFPFSQVERDQRALSFRSCRDNCCARCVQT